ncbi:hypothetical protein DOE51_09635 [Bdellovibrio sp. NC01]|nr:hypothetical protein DOE51_09635 [Bdellovibrio sp. NC01]
MVVLFLGAIVGFNFSVDPLCSYCENISLSHKTLNRRYQLAQIVLNHPDAQQIIVGSSRGETTSPQWMTERTGLKTLNLSFPAAGVVTKETMIRFALAHAQIKKVIWYADYFELIDIVADNETFQTKALVPFSEDVFGKNSSATVDFFSRATKLLDRNTFEASFRKFKSSNIKSDDLGAGSDLDIAKCSSENFKFPESRAGLKTDIEVFFDNYVHGIIDRPQTQSAYRSFEAFMKELRSKGIDVEVVILPYHSIFRSRLESEYPTIYKNHMMWIERINKLQEEVGIEVLNRFDGPKGDDQSLKYWKDGVHLTCKGAMDLYR